MEHRSNLARALERGTSSAVPRVRCERLIVLEVNTFARSALARFFAPLYGCVCACDSLDAAECALAVDVQVWTDLIVAEHLPGDASGCRIASTWRLRYPRLRRVVLATGGDELPEDTASIDAVFRKPFNVQELGLFLGS